MTTAADLDSRTLGDGEATLHYDVRGDLAAGPPLFLFAAPMEAAAFGALAAHFTDRPVVTYDPRGAGRNPRATSRVTPDDHADDLHRVITALGVGPVDCFGSSGGAVNLLRLAETHPEDVRTVVAHEPPTCALLPDRDVVLAALDDLLAAYDASGEGAAMARFIRLVMTSGELPASYLDEPAPDPSAYGMSSEDSGDRTSPLLRSMPALNLYEPDVDALRALGDRLVIAYGAGSASEMAARAARSVSAAVGVPATEFPSHHAGFLPAEGPHPGEPDAFAARLREVLG